MKKYIIISAISLYSIFQMTIIFIHGNKEYKKIEKENEFRKEMLKAVGMGGIDYKIFEKNYNQNAELRLKISGLEKYKKYWRYKDVGFPIEVETSFITCEYGIINKYKHAGIDMRSISNLLIYAVKDGTVDEISYSDIKGDYIRILHDDMKSNYAHLSRIDVTTDEFVKKGQIIGVMGDTGIPKWCTAVHLHFSLQIKKGKYWYSVNPLVGSYLKQWVETKEYKNNF